MIWFTNFFINFYSWNALIWVIIAFAVIVISRLVKHVTKRDFYETVILFHGAAVIIAGINLFAANMVADSSDVFASSDRWVDILINQFTLQSAIINGLALGLHIFIFSRESITEDNDKSLPGK
ncbi:hypothetical protein KKF05_05770 [Patescibacteria group bacterium]|nr:hypothetical protein [Patescibacteria group bacterium]MBU1029513.1 hypothetical protein [Patescibacteria group bacterium]MBU1915499.1 hypothetical protein [Patescibacteria group bacterium]